MDFLSKVKDSIDGLTGDRPFIHDDFMLTNDYARALYHESAEKMPIIDYHCHLPPVEIAEDKRWEDIAQVWLGGDHYKWRLMRSNGIDEEYYSPMNADIYFPYDENTVDEARRAAFDSTDIFKMVYVGETTTSAANLASRSFSSRSKEEQMLTVCTRAIDKSIVELFDHYGLTCGFAFIASDENMANKAEEYKAILYSRRLPYLCFLRKRKQYKY